MIWNFFVPVVTEEEDGPYVFIKNINSPVMERHLVTERSGVFAVEMPNVTGPVSNSLGYGYMILEKDGVIRGTRDITWIADDEIPGLTKGVIEDEPEGSPSL